MRRLVAPLAAAAALVLALEAAATLTPVRREFGELSIPRVGPAPDFVIPVKRGGDRVRVLVRLRGASLAAWEARRLAADGVVRKLDVRAPQARRYLALLTRRQVAATSAIRRAIPRASFGRSLRVVLNALTVEVPVGSLARLRSLSSVTHVYPSLRYVLRLSRSPGLIGATALGASTGARGEGVKIAVIDDGVDQANPFFDPAGFEYPEGFPKGQRRFTTPKVIVAKAFPAPGTPPRAGRALDRADSFHGTHVGGIAAGNADTAAPSGLDHPDVAGLSGVAPRAWIGNYRVFSLPTPIGSIANTPEVAAAFEEAVSDGMDVINFSGGGIEAEPVNDALIEVVANVAAAGVVPVIAAGNDRDDLGEGSAGSPGTAPDAISVAAVSDSHVFAPALSVEGFREIPYTPAGGVLPTKRWASQARPIVDVGSLTGRDGQPVDRYLCAPGKDPNANRSTLRAGALRGAIALVSRGLCSFVSKVDRARKAGAAGVVFVDNRPGAANPVPLELEIPGLMIGDLDGADLRAHLAGLGGRATATVGLTAREFDAAGGVVTSFSSAGPTAFGHALKPDVAAPGGAILSSTNRSIANSPFAVFDGTSMATPHVAGAAALLLQRHPGWSPAQVKSALISTAGAAWADSARTVEAPVTLAGGGLVELTRADDPRIFTAPSSLSFGDLNVNRGGASRSLTVAIEDAGGGGGEWSVEVRAQRSTPGASLGVPTTVEAPGLVSISANATAGAEAGENSGYLVLRRGEIERRLPYLFLVTRPGLENAKGKGLQPFQAGDTRQGASLANVYRFPASPFGHPPNFGVAPPMNEDGGEDVYTISLDQPAINFGVAVEFQSPNALIDPFVLGSRDENDVQGAPATPINVNTLTQAYLIPNGAAAAFFPRPGRYVVSVDSGRDPFTDERLAGRYVLRSWVDDLLPPVAVLETGRVAGRRPVIAARILDFGAGVDPLSLVISYGDTAIGAAGYDPVEGLALFPIPPDAPPLRAGRNRILLVASDFQESKNVQTVGTDIFPNTAFVPASVRVVVNRAIVSWLAPARGSCAARETVLLVSAEGPRRIRRVRFLDGEQLIGVDRRGEDGVFSVTWRTARETAGRHRVRAVAVDAAGRETSAARPVRVCR